MAADLLTTIRAEIDSRLDELAPVLEEYAELSALLDALLLDGATPATPSSTPSSATRATLTVAKPGRRRSAATKPIKRSDTSARKARRVVVKPRRRGRPPAVDDTGRAILAALEHGSHTVAELAVVTGLPASQLRESARKLLARAAIAKTEREGRSAYALAA
jgi:DNA-binding transcriptional ArsR family regulator